MNERSEPATPRTRPHAKVPPPAEPRNQVVVGYDGSPASELALAWAQRVVIAERRPLKVLVAAVDPVDSGGDGRREHQGAVADRAAKQTVDVPESLLTIATVPQAAVPALLEASRGASMLVLGAQGHGAVHGLVMGSVSQHVSRHAACPVVVVRPAADPASDRVVVGVDGSEHGRAALRFAFEYVHRFGGSLRVLYAIPYGAATGGAALFGYADSHLPELRAELREWLDDYLDDLRIEFDEVEVDAELAIGSAARLLSDRSLEAAMVVVGSRGRGGFAGLMLGSVSASVLHHAACPVTVVR